MQTIKLGIDNGNYNTKSSDRMLYASGFTVQDTEFIVPDMQLFHNDKYYAIGDKRMSFQQDKALDDDTFILSLPAMANAMKLAEVNEAEFILGVGLPMELYGTQRAAFRNYFLREKQTFVFEGIPYSATIRDVQVFPQGYAALCKHFNEFRDYHNVTIVDIGGYTVDIMTVTDNKPSKSSCISLRKGTITLFNNIRGLLQQHNIILSDELIGAAIRGKTEHIEEKFICTVVDAQVQAYVKDLLNALRERGYDLQLPIAFAGGGAELLGDRLKTDGVNAKIVLDRFANAEGYKALIRP